MFKDVAFSNLALIEGLENHLSLDPDEMKFEPTQLTAVEARKNWREWKLDLSHLTRSERDGVLQHDESCYHPRRYDTPHGEVLLHLFSQVQVRKGVQRVNAAILEHDGSVHVVMGA